MKIVTGAAAMVVAAVIGGCSAAPRAAPSVAPTARATIASTHSPTAPPSMRSTGLPAADYLYDPTVDARAEVEAAFAAAKKSGKRVLIDYGADWCPDCHSLAAFMEGSAGVALIDPAFVVVKVDVGFWDHNLDVAGEYGDAIAKGIPAVVVYSADGKLIGSSADGSLANARTMTEAAVLGELAAWAK